MTTHTFIRTWRGDLDWLKYCLRSFDRRAVGFAPVITVECLFKDVKLVSEALPPMKRYVVNLVSRYGFFKDDYIGQQVSKLYADQIVHAQSNDLIMHLDSDCFVKEQMLPTTFLADGNPITWMRKYDTLEDNARAWQPITSKACGFDVEYEYMCRHPFLYPHWFYQDAREQLEQVHKKRADAYLIQQPYRSFSEFNFMGAIAHRYFPTHFEFRDVAEHEQPESPLDVAWSWGGLKPERQAWMEEQLK